MRSRSSDLDLEAVVVSTTPSVEPRHELRAFWPVCLVALCYAGYIKGLPLFSGLGVDLTGLFLILALAGALMQVVRRRYDSRTLAGVALVWLSFSVGMVNGVWTEAGPYKVILLCTVTLFCAASPAMLLTTPRARRWFLTAVLAFAVVMAAGLLIAPDQGAQSEFGRRTLEGSNSIGTARVVGAGAVTALMLGLGARKNRWFWLSGAGALAGVTVLVGSRGPFIALVVAAVLVLMTAQSFRGARRLPTLVLGSVALVGILLYVTQSGNRAAARITGFLTGESVDRNRLFLIHQSLSLIKKHPLGIGWGGFANAPTEEAAYFGRFPYPHNMFLEVIVEGGWIVGVMLVGLVVWSVRGYLLRSEGPDGAALYALGVYWFLVAQTSGDVNANRMTWVALFLGVLLYNEHSLARRGERLVTSSSARTKSSGTRALTSATTMTYRPQPGVGKTGN